MISKKIILTGSFGVGKTSLFNQFIYQQFSDKYLTTLGVKVNKKSVFVGETEVSLLVWDIAGEISQDKVPASYFLGASGIVYVVDLTRPSTFVNMEIDIKHLREILPDSVIKIVANKLDLLSLEQLENMKNSVPVAWDIATSAKTGEKVADLFADIAQQLLAAHNQVAG
jgi:small GTP-binding protein